MSTTINLIHQDNVTHPTIALMPSPFTTLPMEIIEEICSHLGPKSLATMAQCSSSFCTLSASAQIWKKLLPKVD